MIDNCEGNDQDLTSNFTLYNSNVIYFYILISYNDERKLWRPW
jgi:hypothetical protein